LYPSAGILLGPAVVASLAKYHTKWAFLSVVGVTTDGVFNNNEMVVEVQRQMLASAERTIVLADHTKIGCCSLCRLCDPKFIHLATDADPSTDPVARRLAKTVQSFISPTV
jgi:DeoR/GlpR family transcriptional regulator of sugar metabolism